MSMDELSLTYEDLHIERVGPEDAPPIVVLHGWGSSAANMRPIAHAVADRWRVWNVDLPGHGFSPAPPEAMGVPEHARLVADLIDAEAGGRATIIGHSNGGRIALHMASSAAFKQRVDRLVLISPSGVPPLRTASYHVKRTTARALKAPFAILPGRAREFGLDWLRHSLVWKLLGSSDYRALSGTMQETFVRTVNFYVDERLSAIDVPVLLFWGTKDEAVTRHQIDIMQRTIPDVGVVELEDAGHYGYLDDFDTFLAATLRFLDIAETESVTEAEDI